MHSHGYTKYNQSGLSEGLLRNNEASKYNGSNVNDRAKGNSLVQSAKMAINARGDKLKYERDMLMRMKGDKSLKPRNDVSSLYNMQNLMKGKNLMNPNLYSYQYVDPIYYPMEMPTNGEPMTLPKVELGMPMHDPFQCNCCSDDRGMGLAEILALLKPRRRESPKPIHRTPRYTPPPKKITPPKSEKVETPPRKKTPKDAKELWRKARNFVNIGKWYFVAHKYGRFSKTRNDLINGANQAQTGHQDKVINWFNQFQVSFYNEFREIPDLNLSFNNYSGKLTIQKQSQIIIAVLNIFLKNLLANSSKGNDIPSKVQDAVYSYIKERAYFGKKYLSTYEINRLDFNFYGGIKNHSDESIGMLIALFMLSKTFVQRILLQIKTHIPDFKTYKYIDITMKYVGSILHYLVRDSFKNKPNLTKDVLALMNYYRNYHIHNPAIEQSSDVLNNNIAYKDTDEYSKNLVPEDQITCFFQNNNLFCEKFKTFIFRWAVGIGRFIRLKYAQQDKNLQSKKEGGGNNMVVV